MLFNQLIPWRENGCNPRSCRLISVQFSGKPVLAPDSSNNKQNGDRQMSNAFRNKGVVGVVLSAIVAIGSLIYLETLRVVEPGLSAVTALIVFVVATKIAFVLHAFNKQL